MRMTFIAALLGLLVAWGLPAWSQPAAHAQIEALHPDADLEVQAATVCDVTQWHPPGTHLATLGIADSCGAHEHGEAPPVWVTNRVAANALIPAPFSQTRESHTGYKGVSTISANGVQRYLVAHTPGHKNARSHGDHDGQDYFNEPGCAAEACFSVWQGILNFQTAPDPRPQLKCGKASSQPASISHTPGGELWYLDELQASPASPSGRLTLIIVHPTEEMNRPVEPPTTPPTLSGPGPCAGIVLGDGSERSVTSWIETGRFASSAFTLLSPTLASYAAIDPKNPSRGPMIKFLDKAYDGAVAVMSVEN